MKEKLLEISIIRPVLIFIFLIGYHAFAPWGGAWSLPSDVVFVDNVPYKLLDKILYSILLELFVFISGYLFSHQLNRKTIKFSHLFVNKINRLIIPCVVFSIAYAILIGKNIEFSLDFVLSILSGLGHLWFLPMLFWCFIFSFLFTRTHIDKHVILVIVLIISVLFPGKYIFIPLQLNKVFYYEFFFWMGFVTYGYRSTIINFSKRIIIRNQIVLLTIYLITFVTSLYLRSALENKISDDFLLNIKINSFLNLLQVIYSLSGVLVIYLLSIFIVQRKYEIPGWYISLNSICMGVYIFHNFIFRIIYDMTPVPYLLPSLLLPWVAYITSLALGVVLTRISVHIPLLRSLI